LNEDASSRRESDDVILEYVKIFLIGILEDFLSSFNTKTLQRNNQLFSFLVSFISVILWYYAIAMVVENIQKFLLILIYACGGGLGDIVTIRFDKHIERFEKMVTRIFRGIRLRWPIEFVFQKRRRKLKRRKLHRK